MFIDLPHASLRGNMQENIRREGIGRADTDKLMIIAGILFLLGILIGLSYGFQAIIAASAALTVLFFPLWIIRGEFGFFSIFIWIGYLFALQSGFLLGSYLGTPDEDE